MADKKPKNISNLKKEISEAWENIDRSTIQKLALSFEKRTVEVIRKNGRLTKY